MGLFHARTFEGETYFWAISVPHTPSDINRHDGHEDDSENHSEVDFIQRIAELWMECHVQMSALPSWISNRRPG